MQSYLVLQKNSNTTHMESLDICFKGDVVNRYNFSQRKVRFIIDYWIELILKIPSLICTIEIREQ